MTDETGIRLNRTGRATGDRYRYLDDDKNDGNRYFYLDEGTYTIVTSRYVGKQFDPATGLYNYGYRDYSPQVARFTTVDPICDGNNWFCYVNNDPVNFVDLWGLEASDGNYLGTEVLKELYVIGSKSNKNKNVYEDTCNDLTILKENINKLNNELQNNEKVNANVDFAAKTFLKLDLNDKADYEILKNSIEKTNNVINNIDESNINMVQKLSNHSDWEMYVSENDKEHKINVVTDLANIDKSKDVAIFYEITHFNDTINTKDNYEVTREKVDKMSKQESLETAQNWTFFYQSAFGR